jgi:dolichyl-phosphate-mannose-protein mannosyltransferase
VRSNPGNPPPVTSPQRPPSFFARLGDRVTARARSGSLYDQAVLGVIAGLVILVACTFRDYGITTDEYVQHVYGQKLWAFYSSGFADRSVFAFDNLYLYGGLFDMLAVALQSLSPFDEYETRHLLCGLVGVLGVVGTWRLARELAGPRAGFLAVALLALTSSWYGAMFNNTKDIPFAVGMVWMLYFICRIAAHLPRPPASAVIWFGVALGLTLGIRVGAVFGLFYLLAVLACDAAIRGGRLGWTAALRTAVVTGRVLLPALVLAYGLMAVFWPWSVLSPFNPIIAVGELTHFPFRTALDGRFYRANDLPPSYLVTYLAIKLPEITLIGVVAAVALLFSPAPAAPGLRSPAPATERRAPARLIWLPVVLAIILPLFYFLLARPALYNGIRHFFFVIPPLCVVAAVGLSAVLRLAHGRARWAGVAVSVLMLAAGAREVLTMVQLHPHQYVYFNSLVGGPSGAFRRYEMDYWSNFVPEALDLLQLQLKMEARGKAPPRKYTVGLCTKEEILSEYAPPNLTATKDWQRADFVVTTTNTDCDKFAGGRTIIEIEREGAVLGVVKDRRPGTTAQSGPPIR